MSLKRQLFVASLLMLLIPWAGLQFVLDLDRALREQAGRQLHDQAERMARGLTPALTELVQEPLPEEGVRTLYAETLSGPLLMDGYENDWPGYDDTDPRAPVPGSVSWRIAVDRTSLYLLVQVGHRDPVYYDPGQPGKAYEHLRLYWQDDTGIHERLVRTSGFGPVEAWRSGRAAARDYRISGAWQPLGSGYQLELKMPRPGANRIFSFGLWRPSDGHARPVAGPGIEPDLPRLVSRLPGLEQQLGPWLAPGQRARVLTPRGQVIADSNLPGPDTRRVFDVMSPLDILEQISLNGLRALVRYFQPQPLQLPEAGDQVDTARLPDQGIVRQGNNPPRLLVQATLAGQRELILDQSLEELLALSGDTLGSVIARSTLLIIGLMLILLGYASWLSWRITRLQRQVRASVDDDGRITAPMPRARARDELGDLSRQFSQMVENLQGYTRYLESFARRLSHELKTPVAVMRSSLENLAQDSDPDSQARYLQRAHQATDRLSQILQGMSEAARLEQSFDHAEKEDFDLAIVAREAAEAYQALDPGHRIHYQGPVSGCTLHGSPELIVQMLDKLVDNARDFTPGDGRIEIRLQPRSDLLELSVFNQGSTLPAHLTSEIFSPFVSLREGSNQGHLGQGLLIVRLIAEHHQGQVHAVNSRDGDGVIFRVSLPRGGRLTRLQGAGCT